MVDAIRNAEFSLRGPRALLVKPHGRQIFQITLMNGGGVFHSSLTLLKKPFLSSSEQRWRWDQ